MSSTPQDPQDAGTPEGSVPPPPPPPPVPSTDGATPPPPGAGSVPPPAYGAPAPGGYPPPGQQAPGYGQQTGGYAPAPGYAGAQPPLSDSDQRMWALLGHLLPILGLSFVPPLVVWLVFKDRGRYVEEQAKEALNFQLTLLIAYVVGIITAAIIIGFLILAAAWIAALVFGILAAIAANKGEPYRYPMNIRFIK